jgi:hypothetical protein
MAVQRDSHSSGQRKFSDDDAEAADCSPSLLKKEMLARENDYDDEDSLSVFPDTESEGPPDLSSSSGDDEQDNQDRQDFIRESAELFESDGHKKSRQRLADFSKGELLERIMQLEKEEQAQKSRYARPGSVRSFQSDIEEDKAARDLLRDRSTSRKRAFRAAHSPQQHKPSHNSASASDSDKESTTTDSTRSTTRKLTNFPWIPVKRFSHREFSQENIRKLLEQEAERLMLLAGDYTAKKPLETDLGPFKRSHKVCFAHHFPNFSRS